MKLRLRDPSLNFWVDVRVMRRRSRFLAVADLAGVPEIGLGHSLEEAVAEAIAPELQRMLGDEGISDSGPRLRIAQGQVELVETVASKRRGRPHIRLVADDAPEAIPERSADLAQAAGEQAA